MYDQTELLVDIGIGGVYRSKGWDRSQKIYGGSLKFMGRGSWSRNGLNVQLLLCFTTAMKSTARLLSSRNLYAARSSSYDLWRCSLEPTRTYATFSRRKKAPTVPIRAPEDIPTLTKKLGDFVLNDQIGTDVVQVKQEDGTILEPQRLDLLLRRIDQGSQVVRQLAARGPQADAALVEITTKDTLIRIALAKEKQVREAQKSQRALKPKQIELNWAIGENDLNLKLKSMEEFLEKGKKVEIMLASKRQSRRATPDEAQQLLESIRERVVDLGARIAKYDGQLLRQATMSVVKESSD